MDNARIPKKDHKSDYEHIPAAPCWRSAIMTGIPLSTGRWKYFIQIHNAPIDANSLMEYARRRSVYMTGLS